MNRAERLAIVLSVTLAFGAGFYTHAIINGMAELEGEAQRFERLYYGAQASHLAMQYDACLLAYSRESERLR